MRRVSLAVLIPLLLVPRLASPQGEPLGPEFRVNTYTPQIQAAPSAASAGNDFVVVWTSGSGNSTVRGQRLDSGGNPLGTEFRVNTGTDGVAGVPVVGANSAAAFVVVWEYSYVFLTTVFGQRYDASGAPVGPEFHVVPTNGYQIHPVVAVAPSGAFLIVWSAGGFGPPPAPPPIYDVFAQLYDGSGTPQGVFRVNTSTPYTQQIAGSAAADPAGNFVVVWGGQYSGSIGWDVMGRRYAASGVPLGPQFRVNTNTLGNQTNPVVATDPSGNFVVAWRDSTGPEIRAQRFVSSGAPLGPEFQVNTSTIGQYYGDSSAIAFDGGGNFVITWGDGAGAQQGDVFAQRYSSGGMPSGPEFRVDTTTAYKQSNPSVASTPGGTFLVTWGTIGPTGFPADVYGQRFGGVFPVKLQEFRLE